MVSIRWSLTIAALALGGLAAVDVRHGPAGRDHGAKKIEIQGQVAGAAEKPTTPATVVAGANDEATTSGACPKDMVEVLGDYCPAPEQICDEFISEKRDRCERFRTKVRCIGKPESKHFCVDRYEYPNEAGRRPTVSVSWDEARDVCANEGKRLCGAEEWTLACEGPERKPYPFGYSRDATACNFDKPYIMPDNFAYDDPQTRAAEIARVNQSEPSGSRSHCVSDYGVYDMTGNVDEWVNNGHGSPQGPEFQSGLKGGYWGPVRNRCRPMTTDHNNWHHGYQIGFRCCKDIDGASAVPPVAGSGDANSQPGAKAWSRPEAVEPSRS
jgi:hypothetical protein